MWALKILLSPAFAYFHPQERRILPPHRQGSRSLKRSTLDREQRRVLAVLGSWMFIVVALPKTRWRISGGSSFHSQWSNSISFIKYLVAPYSQKCVLAARHWHLNTVFKKTGCYQIVIRHVTGTMFNFTWPGLWIFLQDETAKLFEKLQEEIDKDADIKPVLEDHEKEDCDSGGHLQQPPTAIRTYYNEELWVGGGGKLLNKKTEEVVEALRFKTLKGGYNLLMYAANKGRGTSFGSLVKSVKHWVRRVFR